MSYIGTEDLTQGVRNSLREHAQEIHGAARNNAHEKCGHDVARAHHMAWGAVAREYHRVLSSYCILPGRSPRFLMCRAAFLRRAALGLFNRILPADCIYTKSEVRPAESAWDSM